MKVNLEAIGKELGLPAGLVALLSVCLGLMGIDLNTIGMIVSGLVCASALVSLLIDVLKWAGVIRDGNAGVWSAAANLVVFVSVVILLRLYPAFDFASADAQLGEVVKLLALVFGYITQIVAAKNIHAVVSRGLNISAFSFSQQ